MQINHLNLSNLILGKAGEVAGAEELDRRRRLRRAEQEVSQHTLSPEFARWLNLVHEQPDVRLDLLVAVAQRLTAGFYFTPACALQTAEAMLTAPE